MYQKVSEFVTKGKYKLLINSRNTHFLELIANKKKS